MIIKIIQLFHFVLVIVLTSSVFINNNQFKKYALTILIFMYCHYITNFGKCGLTELEYMIRGGQYKEGFIYRVIKPIITIPEKYFENYLYLMHITWIVILVLQLIKNK
jgi:hypothetical protein